MAAGPAGCPAAAGTLGDMEDTPRPSLARRALAILILAVVAWILLKFVIGLLAGIATIVVVVVCVIAAIWAFNQL